MEGVTDSGSENLQDSNCSFVWDENSQLYFHASSGFYHDPVAGWYYSSRDGSYYKFENGSYVPLELEEGGKCKTHQYEEKIPDNPLQDDSCRHSTYNENQSSFEASEFDTNEFKGGNADKLPLGETEGINDHALDNPCPTSLWLEDTLIDLFLSGYSNPEAISTDDNVSPCTINDVSNFQSSTYDDTQGMEGDLLQDEAHKRVNSSERVLDHGGASSSEDNWKAQYGQVTNYAKETIHKFSVVDIWDWSTVPESSAAGKGKVAWLLGRLVKKSAKLHPSLSSNSALIKTAPIREVHLDLVRVATGKIYKLHSPSKKYLASMSTFDSSNPTKDWDFPDLLDREILPLPVHNVANSAHIATVSADEFPASEKRSSSQNLYRDRAAERRILHGGFGVGPGQKKSADDHEDQPSSSISGCSETAAAEALNFSFGAASYARKILESMGWKEGEGLGSSTKGSVEPIEAVGNVGNAGLGWPRGIKRAV